MVAAVTKTGREEGDIEMEWEYGGKSYRIIGVGGKLELQVRADGWTKEADYDIYVGGQRSTYGLGYLMYEAIQDNGPIIYGRGSFVRRASIVVGVDDDRVVVRVERLEPEWRTMDSGQEAVSALIDCVRHLGEGSDGEES